MALMAWNRTLEIGNATIDDQHHKLVDLINAVHAVVAASDSREAIGKVLAEMVEYTEFHFRFEEGLMSRAGYLRADAHKIEHAKFVERLRDFQKKFATGKVKINVELMFFLTKWLREHIQQEDRKVGEHLARQNEKRACATMGG